MDLEVKELLEGIPRSQVTQQDALRNLTALQASTQLAISGLTETVSTYSAGADARMTRVEKNMIRLDDNLARLEDNLASLEGNLNGLIQALAREHSNGKAQ